MSVRKERDKLGRRHIVCDRRWPDGKRFRRIMPNKTVAKELDVRIANAIASGSWRETRKELEHGASCHMSLRNYADHYLEVYCKVWNRDWKRKKSSLRHIKRLLGRLQLKDTELKDVHRFVAKRLREEVKAATVNRDVGVLKHLFEFAVEEEALKDNPIRRIKMLKEYREERRRPTEQEIEQVLAELYFPVRQIVQFIVETGCRPSEALALKREHVDLGDRVAIFNIRKAGDNALIALTSGAIEAILQVPELPGCPYVFWNSTTGTRYYRINNSFARARQRAGVPWLQLKDFRRELGIVIAESGEPLHVAQTQLGHSSIRTTEKYYARYSPEFAISRARKVLEQRFGRKTGGTDSNPTPTTPSSPEGSSSKLLSFKKFQRKKIGGGGRTRTDE